MLSNGIGARAYVPPFVLVRVLVIASCRVAVALSEGSRRLTSTASLSTTAKPCRFWIALYNRHEGRTSGSAKF